MVIPRLFCKLVFVGLTPEMENLKLKVENCGISFGNKLKSSPKAIQSFSILHFQFSIRLCKQPAKLKFEVSAAVLVELTAQWAIDAEPGP